MFRCGLRDSCVLLAVRQVVRKSCAAIGETEFAVVEIRLAEHERIDADSTTMHLNAQFKPAGKYILLNLAGHTRLLYTCHCRSVAIRIERERAVLLGRLVQTETFLDITVVRNEAITRWIRRQPILADRPDILTYGQQEFADHVPIDRAETFVLIERAATPGKGVVVEHLFIEIFEFVRQVVGITEGCIEMNTAITILLEDGAEVLLHLRQFSCLSRQIVHLQERWAAACRIEHVTLLIFAVECRLTHSVQQVGSLCTRQDTCR